MQQTAGREHRRECGNAHQARAARKESTASRFGDEVAHQAAPHRRRQMEAREVRCHRTDQNRQGMLWKEVWQPDDWQPACKLDRYAGQHERLAACDIPASKGRHELRD
ncbi:MAG: hypothetical protein AMJ72_09490 [Acidithiobacillales bacterium SM1_46]|nr:MAG: hypothetical protein AMJ72_09490 [Acidithiobacillales bacterium SM1_46]